MHLQLTRKSAFLLHLGLSLAIFAVLLGLMLVYWFPPPLFAYDGGWQGVRIIAAVDVVLGPALTLLLFKPGKPGLKFDMSLVLGFQVVALAWGIWTTYHARPVVEVFVQDTFYSVSYAELKEVIPPEAFAQWVKFSPIYVYAEYPTDLEEKADVVRAARKQYGATFLDPSLYRPLAAHWPQVRQQGVDLGRYVQKFAQQKPQWLAEYHRVTQAHAGQQVVFIPLAARYGRVVMALEYETGRLLEVLNITYAPGVI